MRQKRTGVKRRIERVSHNSGLSYQLFLFSHRSCLRWACIVCESSFTAPWFSPGTFQPFYNEHRKSEFKRVKLGIHGILTAK
jgi:hypothetical protein